MIEAFLRFDPKVCTLTLANDIKVAYQGPAKNVGYNTNVFPSLSTPYLYASGPGGLGIGTLRPRGLCSVRAKRISPSEIAAGH